MLEYNDSEFLIAGDLSVSQTRGQLITILGSCVTVTAWHDQHKTGAMCHYLLPSRSFGVKRLTDYHYGELVLDMMGQILVTHAPLQEYQWGLFGGADVFMRPATIQSIGTANVACAMEWADRQGVTFSCTDVLGERSRRICLDIETGELQHTELETVEVNSPLYKVNETR